MVASDVCIRYIDASGPVHGFNLEPMHHFRHLLPAIRDGVARASWCADVVARPPTIAGDAVSLVIRIAQLDVRARDAVNRTIGVRARDARRELHEGVGALLNAVHPDIPDGVPDALVEAVLAIDRVESSRLLELGEQA